MTVDRVDQTLDLVFALPGVTAVRALFLLAEHPSHQRHRVAPVEAPDAHGVAVEGLGQDLAAGEEETRLAGVKQALAEGEETFEQFGLEGVGNPPRPPFFKGGSRSGRRQDRLHIVEHHHGRPLPERPLDERQRLVGLLARRRREARLQLIAEGEDH